MFQKMLMSIKESSQYQQGQSGMKRRHIQKTVQDLNSSIQNIEERGMESGRETVQFRKLKWVLRPKMPGYPSKRWGHTAVVHDGRLLLYGGNHTGVFRETVFKIDCESLQGGTINLYEPPQARESHSCCLIGDNLYVFGGCINQELTNELLQLRIADPQPTWRKIQQKNPLPPRQSHASVAISDRHMLIYGGFRQDESMLDDFWICDLENGSWRRIIDIKGALQPKIGLSMTMVGQDIFVFGGESDSCQGDYNNDVYRLRFSSQNFSEMTALSLQITKLQVSGVRPPKRTGHCCVDYKGRMLIVLGGEGVSQKQKSTPVLYNDTWTFNLKTYTWMELLIENRNFFRPRSNFTANLHKNTIYIFGGFINLVNFKWTDELVTLTLYQYRHTPINRQPQIQSVNEGPCLCHACKFEFLPQARSFENTRISHRSYKQNSLQCSLDNVLATASIIATPFEALALLLGCFTRIQEYNKKYVSINIVNLPNISVGAVQNIFGQDKVQAGFVLQKVYLSVIVCGLCLEKRSLEHLVYSYSSTDEGYEFKNASFRLGRQMLICQLFDDDSLHCYLLNIHGISKFVFNRHSLSFQLHQRGECRILNQFLQYHLINPNQLTQAYNNLTVIITEMNKKAGKYELSSIDQGCDLQITIGKNKQLFSQFIRQYFLKEVSLAVSLGKKRLPILVYQKVCKPHSFQQQPVTAYFQKMHIMLNENCIDTLTSSFVKIYAFNRRVAIFCKYPFISGYIQLKTQVPLNASRTRCDNWQVREALQTEIKNILNCSRKRPSQVSISELAKQAQNV